MRVGKTFSSRCSSPSVDYACHTIGACNHLVYLLKQANQVFQRTEMMLAILDQKFQNCRKFFGLLPTPIPIFVYHENSLHKHQTALKQIQV